MTSPPTLRHLAERAQSMQGYFDDEAQKAKGNFYAAANPTAVLALLDVLDAHAQQIATLRDRLPERTMTTMVDGKMVTHERMLREPDECPMCGQTAGAQIGGKAINEPVFTGQSGGAQTLTDRIEALSAAAGAEFDRAEAAEARATTAERLLAESQSPEFVAGYQAEMLAQFDVFQKRIATAERERDTANEALRRALEASELDEKQLRAERDRLQRELDSLRPASPPAEKA